MRLSIYELHNHYTHSSTHFKVASGFSWKFFFFYLSCIILRKFGGRWSGCSRRRWLTSFSLLSPVRGCRPGKIVQMTEAEVRGLCIKSREIFLSQPILLELEAPLKICGQCAAHLWPCILVIVSQPPAFPCSPLFRSLYCIRHSTGTFTLNHILGRPRLTSGHTRTLSLPE